MYRGYSTFQRNRYKIIQVKFPYIEMKIGKFLYIKKKIDKLSSEFQEIFRFQTVRPYYEYISVSSEKNRNLMKSEFDFFESDSYNERSY